MRTTGGLFTLWNSGRARWPARRVHAEGIAQGHAGSLNVAEETGEHAGKTGRGAVGRAVGERAAQAPDTYGIGSARRRSVAVLIDTIDAAWGGNDAGKDRQNSRT